MNRRTPRVSTNARRASRAYDRRLEPNAGRERLARREDIARRERAQRMARTRRIAQEQDQDEVDEMDETDTEEREARMRAARRRRARAQARRASRPRNSARPNRARATARGPVHSANRSQGMTKIDALTARLDRIARVLEKQAEADPLQKPTQNMNRELDDSLRPGELEVGEVEEQPTTKDEGKSEEADGDTTINTKPANRVRPIRMANRSGSSNVETSLF